MTLRKVDVLEHESSGTPPPDTDPPYLSAQTPAPSSDAISRSAAINFTINDALNPVDASTIFIEIDSGAGFVIAYDAQNGGFQTGFSGSVVSGGVNGYVVVINHAVQWDEVQLVTARVLARDLSALANEMDVSYSFTTADETAPFIENEFPAPDTRDDSYETTLVSFRADDLGSAIDPLTINVQIRSGSLAPFLDAISDGVFNAPFDGPESAINAYGATGFDVIIDRTTTYVFNGIVTVRGTVEDVQGNEVAFEWQFDTSPPPTPPPVGPQLLTVEGFPFDIYRFFLFEIRRNDLQGSPRPGSMFLKRYVEGFNRVWQQIVVDAQRLPKLWSIDEADDAHLKYLKAIVGWTDAPLLKKITDAIDDATLRRLIAVSGRMWKQRGPEDTILDVLGLLTVARARIWNWFDFRWVLDETELGEEHEGHDPWIVDLPSTIEQEILVDESTFFNRATGDAVSCVVALSIAGAVKAGDVFQIASGPHNGVEATISGKSGTGPTTIFFAQDLDTNGIPGAFTTVEWRIIDRQYRPDDAYRSNLRIVDSGMLDRTLVKRVLRLMRPSGERYDITYLSFLDLFSVEGDDTQWDPPTSGNLVIEDGLLKMNAIAIEESTHAIVVESLAWTEYVFSARVRGSSGASGDRWGLIFYRTTTSNYYALMIDSFDQEAELFKVVGGVATSIAIIDLNAVGFNILPATFYTLRVTVVEEGATNRIQLFVDGFLLLSTTDDAHSAGSVGFMHDVGASIEIDEVEVIELSKGIDSLEINEFP